MLQQTYYDPKATEIMVIDDNPATLKLLTDLLALEGFIVRPSNSARLALTSLSSRLPDMILMDVRMPDMNGYDLCRKIKENPYATEIPVIFVSGLESSVDKVKGFNAGAVDYLTKPFENEEILARINLHLNLQATHNRLARTSEDLTEMNALVEEEIAEKTALADKLAKTAETLQDLYDNSPCGYHSLDAKGFITRINTTELKWLGYQENEMLGRHIAEFMTAEGQEVFKSNFDIFKQIGFRKGLEIEFFRKDGTVMPLEVNATALYDRNNCYCASRSTLVDITDRRNAERMMREMNQSLEAMVRSRTRQLEEMYAEIEEINTVLEEEIRGHLESEKQLIKAKESAEAASTAKSRFLANMSHEIRTPLNGVIGMTELALMTEVTEEQRGYLELSKKSSISLLRILNDVLDYSKIEEGMLRIETGPVDIAKVIDEVISLFDSSIQQKDLHIFVEIDEAVSPVIEGDAIRLRQILTNLVGNAVKFTSKGYVIVGVRNDGPGGESIQFYIKDTGIGIPEGMREKIFERFVQMDSSYTKEYQGAGLGLTISRKLVELMRGKIWTESNSEGGSVFRFTVPAKTIEYSAPDILSPSMSPQITEGSGVRPVIMVVEDDHASTVLLSKILDKQGYTVIFAENGMEALEKLEKSTVDMVLMDIQMPKIDGVKTLEVLRAREAGSAKKTPVIAVTAYALHGDREKFLSSGFDGYISKPINIDELHSLINIWFK